MLVAVTTVSAMIWNIWGYVEDRNWTLTVIGSIILVAGLALIVMTCGAYGRARQEIKPELQPAPKD